MVDKYISQEKLLELYVDGKYDTAEYHVSVPVIIQNIKDMPAADVRPVVHGEWIKNGYSVRCSECLYDMPLSVRNFCPNCGADMRSEPPNTATDEERRLRKELALNELGYPYDLRNLEP